MVVVVVSGAKIVHSRLGHVHRLGGTRIARLDARAHFSKPLSAAPPRVSSGATRRICLPPTRELKTHCEIWLFLFNRGLQHAVTFRLVRGTTRRDGWTLREPARAGTPRSHPTAPCVMASARGARGRPGGRRRRPGGASAMFDARAHSARVSHLATPRVSQLRRFDEKDSRSSVCSNRHHTQRVQSAAQTRGAQRYRQVEMELAVLCGAGTEGSRHPFDPRPSAALAPDTRFRMWRGQTRGTNPLMPIDLSQTEISGLTAESLSPVTGRVGQATGSGAYPGRSVCP